MKMIEVNGLNFGYNKYRFVLDEINLSIESGTVNILLGLNGSGKTTLIKLLAGLYVPACGEILVNERNLTSISIKERSKILSYVAQASNLIDDFTVKDYLLFGKVNKMNFYQSPKQSDVENVEEYAEKFGITDFLPKKLGELSGGERQIVSICAAVIQDTKIIILDEPTSALDIKNQHKVLKLLKEISLNEDKAIILSSHNPNHALYLDSNVFLLKDGKIIDSGTAKEIITVENLKSIYGDNICNSCDLGYSEISFKD
ncbi:MAG: ABC transporter ATP-binding protein [Clostridia bacterium]|nr:ABC transporter ATP-binding protein [Clostridia bacterium]